MQYHGLDEIQSNTRDYNVYNVLVKILKVSTCKIEKHPRRRRRKDARLVNIATLQDVLYEQSFITLVDYHCVWTSVLQRTQTGQYQNGVWCISNVATKTAGMLSPGNKDEIVLVPTAKTSIELAESVVTTSNACPASLTPLTPLTQTCHTNDETITVCATIKSIQIVIDGTLVPEYEFDSEFSSQLVIESHPSNHCILVLDHNLVKSLKVTIPFRVMRLGLTSSELSLNAKLKQYLLDFWTSVLETTVPLRWRLLYKSSDELSVKSIYIDSI